MSLTISCETGSAFTLYTFSSKLKDIRFLKGFVATLLSLFIVENSGFNCLNIITILKIIYQFAVIGLVF